MASSGNFPVLNPLYKGQRGNSAGFYPTITQGNTRFHSTNNQDCLTISTVENLKTGKWYWEFCLMDNQGDQMANTGVADSNRANWDYTVNSDVYGTGTSSKSVHFFTYGQIMRKNGSDTGNYSQNNSSHSVGDVFGFALDTDNGKAYAHKNGTYYASGNPATGANPGATWTVATEFTDGFTPYFTDSGGTNGDGILNFGQDSTFGGAKSAGGNADENGFGDFQYSPPAGFLAVCSANLPIDSNIDPAQTDTDFPAKQFNTVNYTGNRTGGSTTNNITGVGFQPDLVWLKIRTQSYDYRLIDSSRGAGQQLRSNQTNAESTEATGLTSFDSDGFTVSGDNNYNSNGDTFVAWSWRANGGTTSSNGNGSITSTVQSSTSGGFSIITYTGNGSSGATIGHSLSQKPEWIIVKNRSSSEHWTLYHVSAGATDYTTFTASAFTANSGFWNDTEPTNSLITLGNNARVNSNGDNYVCYAWHGVDGYSKFSNYKGTGNSGDDGVFVYTGFRPKLLYLKKDGTTSWNVFYSPPKTFNTATNAYLTWDTSDTEANGVPVDFLSSGFKVRSSGTGVNASGTTFYYGCWGDVPWKYNNAF